MPRVTRNYQREDFSGLLAQMQRSEEEPAPDAVQGAQNEAADPVQVSQEKRRRDSLMSNRSMRYAYSSVEKRLHDRDCAEVPKIPDAEFEMLAEYRTDMKRCWLCGRRAIVRAGVSCEDAKHMDAYMDVLRRFGAMSGELHALIIVHHARLFDVQQNSVCIRCGEDTWMLCGDREALSLYHNDYEVQDDYTRLFKSTFHLQQTAAPPHAFRSLINSIFHYSWADHVERFRAGTLLRKQEQLRKRLQDTPNVMRRRRWSLLYRYYAAVDHAGALGAYCAENRAMEGTSQPGCQIVHCRVRRWEAKRFLKAAERLKEDRILAADEEYAAACEALGTEIK